MFEGDPKKLNQSLYEAADGNEIANLDIYLRSGAQVNSVHEKGRTALHAAAAKGHDGILYKLFQQGTQNEFRALMRMEDEDGKTARDLAIAAGQEGAFARALKISGRRWLEPVARKKTDEARMLPVVYEPMPARMPVRATDVAFPHESITLQPLPENHLDVAAFNGDIHTINRLVAQNASDEEYISRRDKNGLSALDYAIQAGKQETIERLVELGADVNASAEFNKVTPLMRAVVFNRIQAVDFLRKIADVNAQDIAGNNALAYAVDYSADASLELLLAMPGINVDLANDRGRTALHQAAIMGRAEPMQMLMKAGANPVLADHEGVTPAGLAREYGNSYFFAQALKASKSKRLQGVASSDISR